MFTPLTGPAQAAALYDRVRSVVPRIEWETFEADVEAILALKRERNAIILAHNYQTPEIFHCVADIVGDSLALAREAARTVHPESAQESNLTHRRADVTR